MGGREYTSGRLVTKGKGDWLYGRIEVCAKLPSGLGTWPAAWMLPTDWEYGAWPASGEIDIMEHVGYDQDVIVQSVHNEEFYAGKAKSTSRLWPFDRRMHILLNLAFGGDWGGARGTDEACLPAEYAIDYVRVYQSPEITELTSSGKESK